MRPPKESQELEVRQKDAQSDEDVEGLETSPETDEDELDESNIEVADDGRWDAFILDDDGDPLPEYGDFWFPD